MVVRTSQSKKTDKKKDSQKDNEPKKTPVQIPSNKKVLENVKNKRKITRLLERQAILYGIDCLTDGLTVSKTDYPMDCNGN